MQSRVRHSLWVICSAIVVLIGSRLWLAESLPLMDTTEARYSEVSRKMVETHDWVVPQADYGVPYLAKPPLAFWLSALGIVALGTDEFAPRALIFASSILFCGGFFLWAKGLLGGVRALAGVAVLTSSLAFYVSMAAVMTDMILTICVGSALMSFWKRYHGGKGRWEVVMYAAIGVGILTKGPLAAVLVLGPLVAWGLLLHRLSSIWARFAWLKGGLLVSLVAVPWFLIAEWRNPGFLEYFILGEHFGRFLVPDWSGDMYGRAHELPRGSIWLFYLLGTLPWSLLLLPRLVSRRALVTERWRHNRELILFATCWAAAPLLLFSFSANNIFPYVLPAIPGTALAAVIASIAEPDEIRRFAYAACISAAAVLCGLVALSFDAALVARHTQKSIVAAIRSLGLRDDDPVYYWHKRYFSADYYSGGAARRIDDEAAIETALAEDRRFTLVIGRQLVVSLPESVREKLRVIAEIGESAILAPVGTPSAARVAQASTLRTTANGDGN